MSDNSHPEAAEKPGAGMILLLVVSWLWVGVPLVWGVSTTVESSMALFRNPPPAVAPK
jgi:hypothetical protein